MTVLIAVMTRWSWNPSAVIRPYIRRLCTVIAILTIPNCVSLKFLHERHLTQHSSRIFNVENEAGMNCQPLLNKRYEVQINPVAFFRIVRFRQRPVAVCAYRRYGVCRAVWRCPNHVRHEWHVVYLHFLHVDNQVDFVIGNPIDAEHGHAQ